MGATALQQKRIADLLVRAKILRSEVKRRQLSEAEAMFRPRPLRAPRRLMRRSNQRLIQSPEPGQNDLKFRPRAKRTLKIEPAAQTVRHDVVEDMQAKACAA